MRRLILIMTAFVMIACGSHGISGRIDDILHDGNYSIKWEFQGCFGAGTEKLEIRGGNMATYTFLDFSQEDGPKERTKAIPWTKEKETKLKEIFEIGINLQDSVSLCTTRVKYVLTEWPASIEFEDLNCEVSEKFQELLE